MGPSLGREVYPTVAQVIWSADRMSPFSEHVAELHHPLRLTSGLTMKPRFGTLEPLVRSQSNPAGSTRKSHSDLLNRRGY